MNTKSKKFERVISHTENAPWWGEIINNLITTGGDVGKKWIEGQNAPTPTVTPNTGNSGNNNNNNNNNDSSNNTLLYVAAGAIVVLLLVVLIKK